MALARALTYELTREDRGDAQVHGLEEGNFGPCVVEQWRLKNGKVQFRREFGGPWRVAKELPPDEVATLLRHASPVRPRKRLAGDVRRERAKQTQKRTTTL